MYSTSFSFEKFRRASAASTAKFWDHLTLPERSLPLSFQGTANSQEQTAVRERGQIHDIV